MPDNDLQRGFEFLRINERPAKPRATGLTEIRGPYYSVIGKRLLADVFDLMGHAVDTLKFSGGAFSIMPKDSVTELIELCHDNNVTVSTGGFMEYVLTQGPDAVQQALQCHLGGLLGQEARPFPEPRVGLRGRGPECSIGGGAPASEVVQLYARDSQASVTRPARQLAGFAKVELAPGESRRIDFYFAISQLALLDRAYRLVVEPGEVELMIGRAADRIDLTTTITIDGDTTELECRGPFYAEAEVS